MFVEERVLAMGLLVARWELAAVRWGRRFLETARYAASRFRKGLS